jgi:hypothetical protein
MMVNVEITLFWDVTSCHLVKTCQLIKFGEYMSTVSTLLAIGSGCEDGRWMELA